MGIELGMDYKSLPGKQIKFINIFYYHEICSSTVYFKYRRIGMNKDKQFKESG